MDFQQATLPVMGWGAIWMQLGERERLPRCIHTIQLSTAPLVMKLMDDVKLYATLSCNARGLQVSFGHALTKRASHTSLRTNYLMAVYTLKKMFPHELERHTVGWREACGARHPLRTQFVLDGHRGWASLCNNLFSEIDIQPGNVILNFTLGRTLPLCC